MIFSLYILYELILLLLFSMIVYVNKINIIRKECVVHIKYGNVKYPVFMRRMNKQIMKVLKLSNDPIIYSIKIDECIGQLKHNGYITLFLIESFLKKRRWYNKTIKEYERIYFNRKNDKIIQML